MRRCYQAIEWGSRGGVFWRVSWSWAVRDWRVRLMRYCHDDLDWGKRLAGFSLSLGPVLVNHSRDSFLIPKRR